MESMVPYSGTRRGVGPGICRLRRLDELPATGKAETGRSSPYL